LTSWFTFGEQQVQSRGHVYGIDDGERLWKLQFLSYYEEHDGEQQPALYSLRYQEVSAGGDAELVELKGIDARGAGASVGPSSKLACIDLRNAETRLLDEATTRVDRTWHICLRRTQAFVNGGYSGPAAVKAADLDLILDQEASGLARVTREQLLERFVAVQYADLSDTNLGYRTDDAVRSGFGNGWVDAPGPSASPLPGVAWLVRAADGVQHYGVLVTRLEQPRAEAPGTVTLQIKAFPSQ
jgi:hypothetical protein